MKTIEKLSFYFSSHLRDTTHLLHLHNHLETALHHPRTQVNEEATHHLEEKVLRKNVQGQGHPRVVKRGKEKNAAEVEVLMEKHQQRKINDF